MSWFAAASSKYGRRRQFSNAFIQSCMTIKTLFVLAFRHTTGSAQSLLALAGLSCPVPNLSTMCRHHRSLDVQLAHLSSANGLQILVDSTGIKFLAQGARKCTKHGPERRRRRRKLHIGIDARTLQVWVICVTSNTVADAALLPQFLEQVSAEDPLLTVAGDGACDTQSPHVVVTNRHAMSIIPHERTQGCAT